MSQSTSGSAEEQVRRSRLHRLFLHLVAYPQFSYQTADRFLDLFPETRVVLSSAVQTLWDTLSTDSGSEMGGGAIEAPQLSREARSQLLAEAGLLRGVNLGLITSWRPSADSIEQLDSLYPGSVACLETLAQAMAANLARDDETLAQLQGTRRYVLTVNERAKRVLTTAILLGYGTGLLISDALDMHPNLTEPLLKTMDFGTAISLPDLHPDDPDQIGKLAQVPEAKESAGLQASLHSLVGEEGPRSAAERTMLDISRYHPVAIPRNLPRYSQAFVVEMLSYLLRWWLGVGIRLDRQLAEGGRRLPSEQVTFDGFRIQRWLAEYSRRWALAAAPQFIADNDEPEGAQEHVLALIRAAVATGQWIARQLAEPDSTSPG